VLRTSTTPAPDIDGVIVHIAGTAGMTEVGQLTTLLSAVVAGQPRHAVIDMTGLDLLTSICIGEMVAFRRAVIAAGRESGAPSGKVVIAGAREMINKSLRYARLNELFELYPDVAAARTALKA